MQARRQVRPMARQDPCGQLRRAQVPLPLHSPPPPPVAQRLRLLRQVAPRLLLC